ncbi:MAG: hypothetical protein H8E13_04630 [Actinobacteria bacterium]|nr:hypothetical protein [Actinomycetota bacterium]
MNENFIYAIIGIVGAIVGGLISLLGNWIYKFYEEKKSSRELIVKTALENWKASIEISKYNANKAGVVSNIYPLEDFIIHAKLFNKLINKREIKEVDISNFIEKIEEINNYLECKRKELKKSNNGEDHK